MAYTTLDRLFAVFCIIYDIESCELIAIAGKHATLGLVEHYIVYKVSQCAYNMFFSEVYVESYY